jgi:hypothetical protein
LTTRVVKGRVHQDTICAVARQPTALKRVYAFHVNRERSDSTVKAIQPRIVSCERAEYRVDLDERDFQVNYARGKRETRCTNTGSQVDRMLTAASSRCRGQQNCIMTDSMAAHRLSQT